MATRSSPRGAQKGEVDLMWVYRYLKDGNYPPGLNFMEKRMVRKRAERFCYLNGELIYLGTPMDQELGKKTRKVLLTFEERWEKIRECHISADGSHNGLEKIADAISTDFHWNGIYKMIKEFIRQCKVCLERHPRLAKGKSSSFQEESSNIGEEDEGEEEEEEDEIEEVRIEPPTDGKKEGGKSFWEKVELRLLGPLKSTVSTHHILVAIDCYSLWPETHVLDSPAESEIANCLMKLVCRYGKMERLFIRKSETVLEPSLKKALTMLKKTDLNIPVTRFNKSETDDACQKMCEVIEKFAKKYKTWPQNLEFCLLALRMSKNQNTEYTPSFLAHLRNINLPKTLTKKQAEGGELNQQEQLAMIDRLMANQKSFSTPVSQPHTAVSRKVASSSVHVNYTPVSSQKQESVPEAGTNKSGYVTRSRTGNAKPKALDDDEFETSTPKRRTASISTVDTPRPKRARIESESSTQVQTPVASSSKAGTQLTVTTPSKSATAAPKTAATGSASKSQAATSTIPAATVIMVSAKSSATVAVDAATSTVASTATSKVPVEQTATSESVQAASPDHAEASDPVPVQSPAPSPALALALKSDPPVTPWEVPGEVAGDSDNTNAEESNKKVDLDMYYDAIKMYVEGAGYPDLASRSFKRLIRDQAKNYCMKGKSLYHEVGPKNLLKKIIMTKQERVKLLTDTHHRTNSKAQMVAQLEDVHWKGKLIDCEAFLLACSVYEGGDLKLGKDSFRNLAETKKMLQFDTFDTYQEISNYLVYDVFSDDATSQRLDHLKRQLKNFKVETGDLFHIVNNKKQAIVTSAPERMRVISEAHLRKGTHADLTATFNQLGENFFWFGMKLDVKIYINYCCMAVTDNKHLLERYFLFREHIMRESLFRHEDESTVSQESGADADGSSGTSIAPKVTVEMEPHIIVKGLKPLVTDTASVTETVTGETVVMSEEGDATVNDDEEVEEILVENAEVPSVSQVETASTTQLTTNNTEEVTRAAVESILLITGNPASEDSTEVDGSQVRIDGTQVVTETKESQTVLETEEESEEVEAEQDVNQNESATVQTADHGTGLEMMVDEDDSDDPLYDTEEDEEEDEPDYYEDGSKVGSGAGSSPSTSHGEKKSVTPRQHFKCSQCNKLFFGPLKFKMHMYKHTGQKPFPCNLCSKKYTNKKSLVIHQRTHTGELPYLCSLCGKRCPSKIALKSHLKCHDGNGGGFPAKCDVCGRVFSRKHLMERHKLHKHTNAQTEFKCTECSKVFGHQRSLKRHYMSSHMGVKNHVCGLCGKGFFRKEYLNGHLLQHGGEASEGIIRKSRASTYKPRPSVFNTQYGVKSEEADVSQEQEIVVENDGNVQRIILHQDENGELRVVDMATEREVKKMLESSHLTHTDEGQTTMVVHIEEPVSGEPQVVHVEQTDENVVEVPIEDQNYVEYTAMEDRPQEYVINTSQVGAVPGTQYIYTSANGEIAVHGNQELIYGQPAVQYEVECVGDVGDEEALSAINLLAQASAQQYETVISQI